MDRRRFLKSLVALGMVINLPPGVALAGATEQHIDQAFDRFLIAPWLFHVDENGMIFDPSIPEPKTRADVFSLRSKDLKTTDDLFQLLDNHPLSWRFNGYAEANLGSWVIHTDEYDERESWRLLFKDPKRLSLSDGKKIIDEWLAEDYDWDEFDYFDSGWCGQSVALTFFGDIDSDIRKQLGIEIIQGQYPGSTYYAAEIHRDLDEANILAKSLKLPFRFSGGNDA